MRNRLVSFITTVVISPGTATVLLLRLHSLVRKFSDLRFDLGMKWHENICRNSVRLAIRKLTYAPEEPAPQPSAEAVKDFMMSPGSIRLEASLDKEVSHS